MVGGEVRQMSESPVDQLSDHKETPTLRSSFTPPSRAQVRSVYITYISKAAVRCSILIVTMLVYNKCSDYFSNDKNILGGYV